MAVYAHPTRHRSNRRSETLWRIRYSHNSGKQPHRTGHVMYISRVYSGTRREIMGTLHKRTGTLLLAVAALGMLLAACGGATTGSNATAPAASGGGATAAPAEAGTAAAGAA